jgi:hypothetical protein
MNLNRTSLPFEKPLADHEPDKPPRPPAWLRRPVGLMGGAVIDISLLLPPRGLGVELCWFYRTTHLPCPGCGLTRSMTHISHGMWEGAWSLNPFGFVFYALCVALFVCALLPISARRRILEGVREHRRSLRWFGGALMVSLMIHGVGRLMYHLWTQTPFPGPL